MALPKTAASVYETLSAKAWHLTHIAAIAETPAAHSAAGLAHVKAKKAAGSAFCPLSAMGTDAFKAGQEKVLSHMTQASRHTKALNKMGVK